MDHSQDIRVNDADFNYRILQLLYNNIEEESDEDPVNSDQDPDYLVSDDDSETSDGSSLDDEPRIEDEDEMQYIVENVVLLEGESEFFWGQRPLPGPTRPSPK